MPILYKSSPTPSAIATAIAAETLTAIDSVHHEIHEGDHYTAISYDADTDIATPKRWSLVAPDTTVRCHVVFEVEVGVSGGVIEFSESPSVLAAGTAITAYNNDRNSANTATMLVNQDTTTQAPNNDGTILTSETVGSAGAQAKFGGTTNNRYEWILKQATTYIVKLTATANNTVSTIRVRWYEHTP